MARGGSEKGAHPSRDGDDDDGLLWQRLAATVNPLPGRLRPLHSASAVKPAAASAPPPPDRSQRTPPPSGGAGIAPTLAPGVAPGLDQRTLQRLRRGQIGPQASLDLHHRTQDEAHRQLADFLSQSQVAGRRCVLIITGKGYGTGGAVGVLKANVPRWLNEPPNRSRVLGFCHAPPALGGEGALLVLLRRLKFGKPADGGA